MEASPEQLAEATATAEQISETTQQRTRVIGWYWLKSPFTVCQTFSFMQRPPTCHFRVAADLSDPDAKRLCRYHSHPHITVLPSHVDVRTQAMYQGLDEGFIGLIFSVFNQVQLYLCKTCKRSVFIFVTI